MDMHFIDHLGKRGKNYLHPGGKFSSDFVVEEILKKNPSAILEIGCGIGATLVSLASKNLSYLVGVDISASQIKMAKRVVNHCKLEDVIQLHVMDAAEKFKFEDNLFDVVFAESVLGILNHNSLSKAMEEVKRVLKPGGIFISNDAIWKTGTTIEIMNSINNRAEIDFGLVQSSSTLTGKHQWEQFFYSIGFKTCRVVEINRLIKGERLRLNKLERKASAFMLKQKIYSLFNLPLLFKELIYRLKLKLFHRNDAENLDYYIFIFN